MRSGGAVLPGFNDSHVHFLSGGLALGQVDLLDAKTQPQIEDTVREWAAAHPDREWVTGRGWYYEPFTGGLPTRQIFDALVPDRPAYLTSYDGHTGWANSRGVEACGDQPPHGQPGARRSIVKDPRTGEPTGVLKEAAMRLIAPILPQSSRAEKIAAIRAAIDRSASPRRHQRAERQRFAGRTRNLRRARASGDALDIRVYAALSARSGGDRRGARRIR